MTTPHTPTAQELFTSFVREKLSGNIHNLATFDFKTLRDCSIFGCPDRYFDCDDTNIMRAIYVLLWGKVLPGLTMESLAAHQYRGDTMNTFHTMFGRAIPGKEGFFAGIEKYDVPESLYERVRKFSSLCSRVGNYVVLPNYYAKGTTINLYRGTNAWRDFFDRFLIQLHSVLCHGSSKDEVLQALVKVNAFCFDSFASQEGFERFARELFLGSYCDETSWHPREIFPLNYHWKNENARKEYIQDATLYLNKAEEIIEKRTVLICQTLKKQLHV